MVMVGCVGRDQIGDVAHDEKLAGLGTKNLLRLHATVATGNEHCARVLPPVREGRVPGFVVR